MEDLIPGLPQEIGLECLIRVPHGTLPLLRQVCRSWKEATESPLFHQLRRSAGSSHHLIIIIEADPFIRLARRSIRFFSSNPYCRLAALNMSTGEGAPLPPIPLVSLGQPFLFYVVASGLHLIVMGTSAKDFLTCNNDIYVYSFLSNTWRRGRSMPGPTRFLFACDGGPSNQVFVAGGHDERKKALKSAMVYDIATDDWTMLPDMAREREDCMGVFVAGKFQVIGGSMENRLDWSRETFGVGEWRWRTKEEEAVPEEEFSKTPVMGGLGIIYKCARDTLLVKEGEEWREVAKLPEEIRGYRIMVVFTERLMVAKVDPCSCPSIVFVMEMKKGVAEGEGGGGWKRVALPKKYHGYFYAACVDI